MRAMRLGCAGLAQRFHAARGAPLWRFAHSGAPLQLRMLPGGAADRHYTSVLHYWQQFRSAMGLVVRMHGMGPKAGLVERLELRLLGLRERLAQAQVRQEKLVRVLLPRLERGVAQAVRTRAAVIALLAPGTHQPALAALRSAVPPAAAQRRRAATLPRGGTHVAALRAATRAPARAAIPSAKQAARAAASRPAAGGTASPAPRHVLRRAAPPAAQRDGMARRAPARNGVAAPAAPAPRHAPLLPALRPAAPVPQAGALRIPAQAAPVPVPAPFMRAGTELGRYQGRQPVRREVRQAAAPAATAELHSRVERLVETRMLGLERAVHSRVVHEIVHGGQSQEQLRKALTETLFSAPVLASLTDRMAGAIARRGATERYRRGGA